MKRGSTRYTYTLQYPPKSQWGFVVKSYAFVKVKKLSWKVIIKIIIILNCTIRVTFPRWARDVRSNKPLKVPLNLDVFEFFNFFLLVFCNSSRQFYSPSARNPPLYPRQKKKEKKEKQNFFLMKKFLIEECVCFQSRVKTNFKRLSQIVRSSAKLFKQLKMITNRLEIIKYNWKNSYMSKFYYRIISFRTNLYSRCYFLRDHLTTYFLFISAKTFTKVYLL